MAVDTAHAPRRTLRFNTPGEALAEAEALVAAERAGTLRQTGNWTLGQALGHLACWGGYPYVGYPEGLGAPWFVKLMLRPLKKRYIRDGLPAGKQIPGAPGGTYGTEMLSTEAGLAKFRSCWSRLGKAPPATPNIIFGPLTHEEWIQLNLRHAELHLGFFER